MTDESRVEAAGEPAPITEDMVAPADVASEQPGLEEAVVPVPTRIRPAERDAILQSLRAGVVPRIGQQHFQVGRVNEIRALLTDVERIADGGSGFRFIIGDYGSGKTFFMHMIRAIAMQHKLVTVHADLSPERRLYATGGQARNLYAELMRNMATRAKPDGGAISSIVERFVTQALSRAKAEGIAPEQAIQSGLNALSELTGGYDFAAVVEAYWRGHDTGNEQLKTDAVRWLRGEFVTRTDARHALGVRTIIDDAHVYDSLKLMSTFVRLAGFQGMLVALDEMVNLYKLASTQARNSNYEQLLRIVNDSTQGIATGLGFMFLGTPDFLMDSRRGLYSYAALQSRLAENTFARDGLVDYSGPIIRLPNLTPEDMFVLLQKLRHVQASGDPGKYLLPDEGLRAFMDHCANRIGDAYFRTPRNTIKTFLDLLAVLEQNPGLAWNELIAETSVQADMEPDIAPIEEEEIESGAEIDITEDGDDPMSDEDDDDLTTFRL